MSLHSASELHWQIAAPPPHAPPVQTSPDVHALPSLQVLPFVALLIWQPVAGSQLDTVHAVPAGQTVVAPGLQVLFAQTSPVVQALESVHGLVLALWVHALVGSLALKPGGGAPGVHVSSVHGFESSQLTAVPRQTLSAWQTSPLVQMLLSLHAPPGISGKVQIPSTQLSVVQTFPSLQTLAAPAQLEAAHASLIVHGLPSLQLAVFGMLVHAP